MSQASSCVQEWTSACLSSCSLGDRHLLSCMSNLRSFPDDARGCQCPFVLCLHPHYLRIGVWASRSFQERIGKSQSFGMWHHHRGYVSNFLVRQPHLRCVEKVGNPLQTKQGNRPSCRHQEGRRGSAEAVLGTSMFSSSETGVSGKFGGRIKGAKYPFTLQDGTWDFPGDAIADRGLIFR